MLEFIIKYWIEVLFTLICTTFTLIFKYVLKKIKKQSDKQNAMESGVQALLRDRLIDRYREVKEKNEISILDRENLEHMYNEYVNLGGNGTVKQLMDELLEIPTKLEG